MIEISLCMIVKNEEETLERCLDSMKGLVEEIVIVDTGSSDRTKEIARRYTEKVYDFAWVDDFSAARNFAFSRAEKAYCMWMDADDVLNPGRREDFLELKRTLSDTVDVVMLPYEMGFDEKGRPSLVYYRERILRKAPAYRFRGRVHEAVVPAGNVVTAEVPIEHRKEKPGDGSRNLRIYQSMEERQEEFSVRDLYYYGRELTAHKEYEKGRQVLAEFLGREDAWVENQIDAARQLAVCFYGLGREKDALGALFQAFFYDVPRGETCCDLGKHFLDRKRYRQAAYWYERALQAEKNTENGAFVNEDCYGFLPAISLCVCYDRMGDWRRAEEYNRMAGEYKPESPYYMENLKYFSRRRQEEAARFPFDK